MYDNPGEKIIIIVHADNEQQREHLTMHDIMFPNGEPVFWLYKSIIELEAFPLYDQELIIWVA